MKQIIKFISNPHHIKSYVRHKIRKHPQRSVSAAEKMILSDHDYKQEVLELMKNRQFLKAEKICQEGMRVRPNDPDPFICYAQVSMRKEEFEEAQKRWQTVRDKFPDNDSGYVFGAHAYAAAMDFKGAEDLCRKGLEVFRGNQNATKNLYYTLISVIAVQNDRSPECTALAGQLKELDPGVTREHRFYKTLADLGYIMYTRDRIKPDDIRFSFIMTHFLTEPLDYSKTSLALHELIARIRDQRDREDFTEHVERFIQKEKLDNPLSVLVSTTASDKDRLKAHLEVLRNGWYHSVHLCYFHIINKEMLGKACDTIMEGREWESFDPDRIFNFLLTVNFTSQAKGDELNAQIYEKYKDKKLPESDPIGLLCHRHEARQALLEKIRAKGATGPALHRKITRRLKVALCLSGQLRGYQGNLDILIKKLGLDRHHYRVFVHTWSDIGRKFPIAEHAQRTFGGQFYKAYFKHFGRRDDLQEYLKERYPNFYALLIDSNKASAEDLIKQYATNDVVIEDENEEPFRDWSNQEKMHYKLNAAHRLCIDCGDNFDLIVRLRPDYRITKCDPIDLEEVYKCSRENLSIFTPGGLVNWEEKYIINDNFAIGYRDVMRVYASAYRDIRKYQEQKYYACPQEYYGHVTLEYNLFCNGIRAEHIPIQATFDDPVKLSPQDIYTALLEDSKNAPQSEELSDLIGACRADLAEEEERKERQKDRLGRRMIPDGNRERPYG